MFGFFLYAGAEGIGILVHYATLLWFLGLPSHADSPAALAWYSTLGAILGAGTNCALWSTHLFGDVRRPVAHCRRQLSIRVLAILLNGGVVALLSWADLTAIAAQLVATMVVMGVGFSLTRRQVSI
jgi:hypothetical protein